MKNQLLTLFALTFFFISCGNAPQKEVESKLPSYEEVLSIITQVNDTWQNLHPDHGNSFWHRAAYHTGNLAAYEVTKNEKYKDFSEAWAEYNEWKGAKETDQSKWKYSYGESDEYVLFGDFQTCFQVYVDLYQLSPEEFKIQRAKEVMEYQMSTETNDYWWWSDGIYMVMPVMTRLYKVTNNPLYLDKMYEYFSFARKLMFDEDDSLFFRDGKYIYPKHKTEAGKKDFWSRGNGWPFAALARVLADLPESDGHRAEYIQMYNQMAQALKNCQNEGGYWTRSLLDEVQAPGKETSGTAFFVYGYLWGINNGYLEKEDYLETVEKAWTYLIEEALQEDGTVGYVQPIGERATQHNVSATTTADFGVGAFLLAASEMAKFVQ